MPKSRVPKQIEEYFLLLIATELATLNKRFEKNELPPNS